MDRKLDEALAYFKEKKGFKTLFLLFRKKYESLGRFGGSIDLGTFSDQEVEELALFMGASPHHLTSRGKLMLSAFEQRLQQTRFASISLLELLEAYDGQKLQSRKAVKAEQTAEQMARLAEYRRKYPQLSDWFAYVEGRTSDTHWIWRLLLEPEFAADIDILAQAYSALPDAIERYPLFSQRVTGNPHALDPAAGRGKLWIHLLHVMAGGQGAMPSQAESLNELLLQHNLLRDDIQNFVTQANLLAYIGDREQPVWRAAADESIVMNVPMRELLKVDKVMAAEAAGAVESARSANVYIVENSGVFSALLDEVPDAPLICTHGQFKLAGLMLMDMLASAGHTLNYSGDFDPEGLSMAVRFKQRYGAQGRVWRMTTEEYRASIPVVELGSRTAKLDAMEHSELGELAAAIKGTGKAGYQEGILGLLIADLQGKKGG